MNTDNNGMNTDTATKDFRQMGMDFAVSVFIGIHLCSSVV